MRGGRLLQVDDTAGGGEAGFFYGAGAGETVLDADDVDGGVWEMEGPGGFVVYEEAHLMVGAGDFEGCPLGEVAAESGEVGVAAGDTGARGIEREVADAGFCGEGNDDDIVFTLYQYLYVLADAG